MSFNILARKSYGSPQNGKLLKLIATLGSSISNWSNNMEETIQSIVEILEQQPR